MGYGTGTSYVNYSYFNNLMYIGVGLG